MSSDSSGGIVLSGDSLKIANQIVIDNSLNVNVLSVNANQYKIGNQVVLDTGLNLKLNSLEVNDISSVNIVTDSVDTNSYKIGGIQFIDNSLNLNVNNITGSSSVFNNGGFANVASNVVDSNQYKVNGVQFVDKDLNLNVNSLRTNSFNPVNIITNNITCTDVNADQYKINGQFFIDKDLNLNVNSLKVSAFNPDKIVTGMVTATSVVVSGKTVIDTNKNINASNITSFNVDTSAISINGKQFVDKNKNIIANNVDINVLTQGSTTLFDANGNMPNFMKSMINFFVTNGLRNYENCDLQNSQLSGKFLTGGIIKNVNLSNSQFEKSSLTQTMFSYCDMRNTNFINASANNMLFANSDLTNSTFGGASLQSSVFYNTNMHNVNISGANISGVSFVNITDSSGINMTGTIGTPRFSIATKMSQGIEYSIYNGFYGNVGGNAIDKFSFYKTATKLSSGTLNSLSNLNTLVRSLTDTSGSITIVATTFIYNEFQFMNYMPTINIYPYGHIWFGQNDITNIFPQVEITPGSPLPPVFANGIQTGFSKITFMYGISPAYTFANRQFSIGIQNANDQYGRPITFTNDMLLHII